MIKKTGKECEEEGKILFNVNSKSSFLHRERELKGRTSKDDDTSNIKRGKI